MGLFSLSYATCHRAKDFLLVCKVWRLCCAGVVRVTAFEESDAHLLDRNCCDVLLFPAGESTAEVLACAVQVLVARPPNLSRTPADRLLTLQQSLCVIGLGFRSLRVSSLHEVVHRHTSSATAKAPLSTHAQKLQVCRVCYQASSSGPRDYTSIELQRNRHMTSSMA